MNEENQEVDAEITPSDIVFDCPNCGHNLVVDYRAAGLQVPCPSCGSIIQAPIPDEMHLEDLDCDAGELLQQLLQTRRLLVRAEAASQKMGEKVTEMTEQLAACHSTLESVRKHLEALQESADYANATRQEVLEMIDQVSHS